MRFIESLSIKKAKNPLLLKENADMIANNQDMEDKRNLFSEKKAKTTKKIALKFECVKCKRKRCIPIKRCKTIVFMDVAQIKKARLAKQDFTYG